MDASGVRTRYPPRGWADPRLTVGPSSIAGRGVVATRAVKAGEVVMIWGGVRVLKSEYRDEDVHPQSTVPLDDDAFLCRPIGDREEPVDDYLNHSCDPSAWLVDEVTVVARRDVKSGEEVTVDCATWDADAAWPYLEAGEGPCRCGSASCRKALAPDDWKQPELQARYAGHFSPYIEKRIRRGFAR